MALEQRTQTQIDEDIPALEREVRNSINQFELSTAQEVCATDTLPQTSNHIEADLIKNEDTSPEVASQSECPNIEQKSTFDILLKKTRNREDLSGLQKGMEVRQDIMNRNVVEMADIQQGDVVLDLCTGAKGSGHYVSDKGAHFIGVDIAENSLQAHPYKSQVATGDATALPFISNGFSHVLTVQALHSFLDIPKGIQEVSRILRPNGNFVLADSGVSIWANDLILSCIGKDRPLSCEVASLIRPPATEFIEQNDINPGQYAEQNIYNLYGMRVPDFIDKAQQKYEEKLADYAARGISRQKKITHSVRKNLTDGLNDTYFTNLDTHLGSNGMQCTDSAFLVASQKDNEQWMVSQRYPMPPQSINIESPYTSIQQYAQALPDYVSHSKASKCLHVLLKKYTK